MVLNSKQLEAAHHRRQWKILAVSWIDIVTDERVKWHTGLELLESVSRNRRLRWFGHVQR